MDPDSPRPVHPLKRQAVKEADDALYKAHEGDRPRPNALFDASGNRLPLSDTDPTQECLRQEWIKLYGEKGGKLKQPRPKSTKSPRKAVGQCPVEKAKLTVTVRYTPVDAPVHNAKVTIKGPVTQTLTTDVTGIVKFTDLPPGQYKITSSYFGKNALVDEAIAQNGSTDWALAKERQATGVQSFPSGANKCNLFVYEMVTGAGYSVPTKPHKQKVFGVTVNTVQIPPNAGDWATSGGAVGTVVKTPEPGDVIAWSHNYSNATGHCGIVSYPEDSRPATKTLAAGDDAAETVTMRRKTVSAHSNDVSDDDQTFWHYYDEGNAKETGNITFRRLNK